MNKIFVFFTVTLLTLAGLVAFSSSSQASSTAGSGRPDTITPVPPGGVGRGNDGRMYEYQPPDFPVVPGKIYEVGQSPWNGAFGRYTGSNNGTLTGRMRMGEDSVPEDRAHPPGEQHVPDHVRQGWLEYVWYRLYGF